MPIFNTNLLNALGLSFKLPPGQTSPENHKFMQQAFGLIHGGAQNKGIKVREMYHLKEPGSAVSNTTYMGPFMVPNSVLRTINYLEGNPALSDKVKNVALIYQSTPNIGALTHEMGHAIDNPSAISLLKLIPGLGGLRTLRDEAAANIKGYMLMRKVYKDDPALLKKYNKLFFETASPAYASYVAGTAPGIGAATGSIYGLGSSIYADKDYYKKIYEISTDKKLTKEQKKEKIEKLKPAVSTLQTIQNTLVGGLTGGAIGTGVAVPAGAYAMSNLGKILPGKVNAEQRSLLNMMKNHANKHGYRAVSPGKSSNDMLSYESAKNSDKSFNKVMKTIDKEIGITSSNDPNSLLRFIVR